MSGHTETPALGWRVQCWVFGMVSLYITLSGLSLSDRILIDVRLNGSDDSDDSIELRNPIVVETKVHDIVFVCISLVHLYKIHHLGSWRKQPKNLFLSKAGKNSFPLACCKLNIRGPFRLKCHQ